jgi:anti-sigma factor RsiW
MNCRQAEDFIFAERDGALSEDQRAALVSHVAACAACQRTRNGLTTAIDAWRVSNSRLHVPDAERAWHDVRRVIRGAETVPHRRSTIGWLGVPLAAAAAIAIGFYLAPAPAQSGATTENAQVASRDVSTVSPPGSTVVYVDDKSGWTFVLAADTAEPRT